MSSKDAHDQQYEILANEILHFVWKPGDLISESSLCQRFGLSRTPVLAILQRLQENGLVRIEPKKGSIVTPLSIETISQLIFERMAVETMVLRDYIRICNPSDVERVRYLYSCLCAVGETYQNPDVPFEASTFMHADLSMHAEWFRRTSKPLLWKRLSSPQSSYTRFCMLDLLMGNNVPDVLSEHREMLALIETRNENGIEDLLTRHLYGGIRRLGSSIYTTYSSYFTSAGGDSILD